MKTLSILSFLLLFSCGQKAENIPTKISFGAALGAAAHTYNGGLFILGYNEDDDIAFKKEANLAGEIYISLPYGKSWRFGAIGWKNTNANKFEGDAYCSMSTKTYMLSEETIDTVEIDINPTMEQCGDNNSPFSHHAFSSEANGKIKTTSTSGKLLPVEFLTCIEGTVAPISSLDKLYNCSLPTNNSSIKVTFHTFSLSNLSNINIDGGVSSSCINLSDIGDTTGGDSYHYKETNLKLPMYENLPFSFEIYNGADCLATNFIKKMFVNGFQNAPNNLIMEPSTERDKIMILFTQPPT